jgi:hypothetical protein
MLGHGPVAAHSFFVITKFLVHWHDASSSNDVTWDTRFHLHWSAQRLTPHSLVLVGRCYGVG